MANLQELYDFYLETNPSTGKIRNATNFLIHACQAMNVSSPEEISDEELEELPSAIDHYFKENYQKAVHDKGILAEMIGRYGPKDGWENTFDILLSDEDENLRQFVLQSLEFCALRDPYQALPYIERFRTGRNTLMRRVAAILVVRLLCSPQKNFIERQISKWALEDRDFVQTVLELLQSRTNNALESPKYASICREVLERNYINSKLKDKK